MKKITSVLFAFILISSLFVPSYAVELTKGTLTYTPAYAEPTEEPFYYSDAFFADGADVGDPHLLAMSFDLAISTFEVRGASYVTKLFEDIGFGDIAVADMIEAPTRDSIGTAIAHKTVDGKNVIAVAIRGEKYDAEWASNFVVGKTGDAKGFSDSCAKVLGRVKDYIAANSLENNKIWIAGYSRAGAIADLAGVYINNNLAEFGATADDLYIFAFEPPAASVDDTVYDNIRIVINKNDAVPNVYPAIWGMHTNGHIVAVGEDMTLTSYVDLLASEEYGEVKADEFLADAFEWLGGRLSRETYADHLEGPISDLLEIFFSKSEADRAKILALFTEDALAALMSEENKSALVSVAWSVMSHESDYLYHQLADLLCDALASLAGSENASALSAAEFNTLKNSVYPILRTLGPVLVDDMIYFEGIDYDDFYANELPDLKMSDTEMGEKDGTDAGFDWGYSDGFNGNASAPASDFVSDYGPDYDTAFNAVYLTAYENGYALGAAHAADLAARGAYDGAKDGERNGYSEGQYREERSPKNEYFWQEEWMTPEYIEAYDAAYAEAYNAAYDRALGEPEYVDPPMTLDSYHILTFIKNVGAILANHHPQNNLVYVKLAGHSYELTDSAEPSCTEDGFRLYHCADCGDDLTVILPAGHKLTHVKATEVSADADGNIEYWRCEVCEKCFADKDGETEIDADSVVVLRGDVNRDGRLNSRDVIAIMEHILGKDDDGNDYNLADYNGDYRVNARDVIAVMKAILAAE